MTEVEGQRHLLAIVDEYKNITKISDAELCRLAGLSPNTLYNLRKYPRRNINLPTFIALVQAMNKKVFVE